MILLLDAGNTRIKWGIVGHDGRWQAEGALPTAEFARLAEVVRDQPGLVRVFGANVAGTAVGAGIAQSLGGTLPPPEWLRATPECCGVRNLYEDPTQLGADRWAALIGAHALLGGACLVVTAGTATTIDVLAADGCFRGGLILPGEALMRRALARDTAGLPFAEGRVEPLPRRTADAIASGCALAQAGAVERMFRHVAAEPGARCVLNGGAAAGIEPLLDIPLVRIDNLVLKGLAVAAGYAPPGDRA